MNEDDESKDEYFLEELPLEDWLLANFKKGHSPCGHPEDALILCGRVCGDVFVECGEGYFYPSGALDGNRDYKKGETDGTT